MASRYDAGDLPRDEAEAALAARQELGPEYEPAIVESFVDRLDKVIDARVAERVEQLGGRPPAKPDRGGLALAIVSVGCGIPITAIAAAIVGLPGVLVAWVGIVLVNMAYAMQAGRSSGGPPRRY